MSYKLIKTKSLAIVPERKQLFRVGKWIGYAIISNKWFILAKGHIQ